MAQKYVEKPLLYNGRKFDIRVWVLVTANIDIFMYKHGYLRTSSFDYDMGNENNYVHLTNKFLQPHGDNYGKHEDGNTLSFEVFQKYLDKEFPNYNLDVRKDFVPRMHDLIIDTILSSKKQFMADYRENQFELFGFDFLVDEDFRTWLIEVGLAFSL